MSDDVKILIVDDRQHIRTITKIFLSPYNIVTSEAGNGLEAIDMMRENDYDLIILDFKMPKMTGQEVLDLMHQDSRLELIPVIVYTAGGFDENIERWLRSSSIAFMNKMNIGEELVPLITDILGDRITLQPPSEDPPPIIT
jgi:two-component system response regulator ResD